MALDVWPAAIAGHFLFGFCNDTNNKCAACPFARWGQPQQSMVPARALELAGGVLAGTLPPCQPRDSVGQAGTRRHSGSGRGAATFWFALSARSLVMVLPHGGKRSGRPFRYARSIRG